MEEGRVEGITIRDGRRGKMTKSSEKVREMKFSGRNKGKCGGQLLLMEEAEIDV